MGRGRGSGFMLPRSSFQVVGRVSGVFQIVVQGRGRGWVGFGSSFLGVVVSSFQVFPASSFMGRLSWLWFEFWFGYRGLRLPVVEVCCCVSCFSSVGSVVVGLVQVWFVFGGLGGCGLNPCVFGTWKWKIFGR